MREYNIPHTQRGLIEFTTLEKPLSVYAQNFLMGIHESKRLTLKNYTHWKFIRLAEYFQSGFVKLVLFYIRFHVVKVLWA
jgi:hypothetical protein